MSRLLMIGIIISIAGITLACGTLDMGRVRGSGNGVSEQREIGAFKGVELATIGTLHIEIGERAALRIEAEDNLLPYFETEVRGDRLWIGTRDLVRLDPTQPVDFYLTTVSLEEIVLSGSGDIEMTDDIAGDALNVTLSGSGDITLSDVDAAEGDIRILGSGKVRGQRLTATHQTLIITGSGDLHLDKLSSDDLNAKVDGSGSIEVQAGKVAEQEITINGSGNYRGAGVSGERVSATINGSGSVWITAQETLEARIVGSGDVHCQGNPQIDLTRVGSGKVIEEE